MTAEEEFKKKREAKGGGFYVFRRGEKSSLMFRSKWKKARREATLE